MTYGNRRTIYIAAAVTGLLDSDLTCRQEATGNSEMGATSDPNCAEHSGYESRQLVRQSKY